MNCTDQPSADTTIAPSQSTNTTSKPTCFSEGLRPIHLGACSSQDLKQCKKAAKGRLEVIQAITGCFEAVADGQRPSPNASQERCKPGGICHELEGRS